MGIKWLDIYCSIACSTQDKSLIGLYDYNNFGPLYGFELIFYIIIAWCPYLYIFELSSVFWSVDHCFSRVKVNPQLSTSETNIGIILRSLTDLILLWSKRTYTIHCSVTRTKNLSSNQLKLGPDLKMVLKPSCLHLLYWKFRNIHVNL